MSHQELRAAPSASARQFVVPEAVIAHRGAPLLAPENTLPAMRAAVVRGAKWVEVDVKLTKDLRPVILHDDKVDRTTNGTGFLAGLNFEDVRRLDARASFGQEFAGIQIPTFQELIETVLDLDVGLQVELKPTPGDDVDTAEIALKVLKDMWPRNRERLFITSFSIQSIHAAARLLPDIPRAFAVIVPPRDPVALLDETKCQVLHLLQDLLTEQSEKILADSGIEYAVAVVNDREKAKQLLKNGAQTISTDIPDLLDM